VESAALLAPPGLGFAGFWRVGKTRAFYPKTLICLNALDSRCCDDRCLRTSGGIVATRPSPSCRSSMFVMGLLYHLDGNRHQISCRSSKHPGKSCHECDCRMRSDRCTWFNQWFCAFSVPGSPSFAFSTDIRKLYYIDIGPHSVLTPFLHFLRHLDRCRGLRASHHAGSRDTFEL